MAVQLSLGGDGLATAVTAGWINDPYGQPLNPSTGCVDLTAMPDTRSGTGTTDSWVGQYQRGYEHAGGINQILMGARTYLPTLGIFTSIDPIESGNDTPYGYPNGPINKTDLTGQAHWLDVVAGAANLASFLPGPVGMIASVVGAGAHAARGRYGEAALSLVGFVPGGKVVATLAARSHFISKVVALQAKSRVLGPKSPLVKKVTRAYNSAFGTLSRVDGRLAGLRVGWSRAKGSGTTWRLGTSGGHNKFWGFDTAVKWPYLKG